MLKSQIRRAEVKPLHAGRLHQGDRPFAGVIGTDHNRPCPNYRVSFLVIGMVMSIDDVLDRQV